MTDELAAPQEGVEVVQPEAQEPEASEATESTEGLPTEATAEDAVAAPEGEVKEAEDETARKSRNERRREARERQERELREAQQAREAAERLAAEMKAAAEKLPTPKQDDFQSYEEYQAALTAHFSLKAQDGREAQRLEAEAKARADAMQQIRLQQKFEDEQNWASQVSEAVAKYPDFQRVALGDHVVIGTELGDMIKGSDVGAEIAYHIGKNPEIAPQLSELAATDPVAAARAFGRLEATVSAPKPKTTSTAPPPISPVGAKPVGMKDPEEMSFSEWEAARMSGKLK